MRIITTNNKCIIHGNPMKDYLTNSFLRYHSSNIKYIKDSNHYIFQYDEYPSEYIGYTFDWSLDEKYLVSLTSSNMLHLYDVSALNTTNKIKLIRKFSIEESGFVKFSPDSKNIVFVSKVNSKSKIFIYKVSDLVSNIANIQPYKIIYPSDYSISDSIDDVFTYQIDWSNDSTKIFVGTQISIEKLVNPSELTGPMGVVIGIDMTSYQITNIFYHDFNLDYSSDTYDVSEWISSFGGDFKVSPNGNKIIIGSWGPIALTFVYQIDSTKYNDKYLNRFDFASNLTNFEWSPDSSKLAISNNMGGYVNIYLDLSAIEPEPTKVLTNNNSELSVRFGDLMSWSGSSNKLAINYYEIDDDAYYRSSSVYIYDTTNFDKEPDIIGSDENKKQVGFNMIKYSPDSSILGVTYYNDGQNESIIDLIKN